MKKHVLCLMLVTVVLGLVSVSPLMAAGVQEEKKPAFVNEPYWTAEGYDYDKLVAAAQAEGSLVARWQSGRAPQAAKVFEEKYGIKTVASPRFDDSENIERLRREYQADNVQVDILGMDDGGIIMSEFIPNNMVVSWTPPDLAQYIDEKEQYPQVVYWQPCIIGYNSSVYSHSPIKNLWELTEPKWKGKFVTSDPQIQPYMWHFFAAAIDHGDEFAAAYEQLYGKALKTSYKNAGWEWVARMFANDMIAVPHDTEVAKAIGSPGQTDPPIGIFTLTRFRDAKEQNLFLGFDEKVVPAVGFAMPTYMVIPVKAPHPNAARLWARFLLTEEGSFPWTTVVGGFSPNQTIMASKDNPFTSSWGEWLDYLLIFDPEQSAAVRRDLIDMWLMSQKK
ncbi:ABC transporter substrate-binding protein [Sphaerochaeta sp. PS]|uniref:ABC transporter substrate-binding protein n=1 Tax=Sphaerochaeta sp. PS TaxID=3076336 RepID=UPI0028A4C059|nr:ABC transporter substrate-binding protein [Sphaerochaeta sp. PS]MDT4763181.1 ABC transporter substrate-binding protein [Sphaerochaeta sp. PS]